MKLIARLASILIGGVVLTSLSFANIVVKPQSAVGLAREDVNTIAEQITVMIEGHDDNQIIRGSGVIVRRNGNVYYVITNRRIVEKEGDYQLQTVDGNRYVVNSRQIQKLGGLDLAVMQFSSNKNYRIAQLGDSDRVSRRQKIYVVGYATTGVMISNRPLIIAEGTIVELLLASRKGYALVYNFNIIQPEMSGGPVLDLQGQLIGINGLAQPDARTGRTDLIAGIPSNYFRSNITGIVALPNQQSPTPVFSRNSKEFFCGISNSQPTTIVRTPRGNIPLIFWANPDFSSDFSSEFSREQRCEEVSARLQEANQNGRLKYIRAGTVGDRPVLCITFEINSPCSLNNVLIFLSPGTDANYVLEKLFNRRPRAVPIRKPVYL